MYLLDVHDSNYEDYIFASSLTNVTTTEINTRKQIFEFGQREVISFFTLVTNKSEHSNDSYEENNIS
jgi:hypothetical protein